MNAMQLICAPSAGLGRVEGSQHWLSLDPLPDPARYAKFAVDPTAWETIELAPQEDPLARLRLERDRHDAQRLAVLVAKQSTAPQARQQAAEALEQLLATAAVFTGLRDQVLQNAELQRNLASHAAPESRLAAVAAPIARIAHATGDIRTLSSQHKPQQS
jgi:hypothetical protein